MLNLLKTDLKRVFKDKLFLILCIIAAGFAFFNPVVYKVLFLLVDMEEMETMGLGMAIDAKTLFFTSFSPGNNLGLIMPIFAALVLCKDFSQGTVRNKVISGKTRAQIFLSMLLTCVAVMCVVMLLHGVLTLLISLLFFEYQAGGFTWGALGYALLSLGFEMLVYVLIAALLSLFIVWTKNAGLAIVLYVAINFLFVIFGGIVSGVFMFVDPSKEFLRQALQIVIDSNVFMSTVIGTGTSYNLQQVLCILLPVIGGTALCVLLGIFLFRKKDLK